MSQCACSPPAVAFHHFKGFGSAAFLHQCFVTTRCAEYCKSYKSSIWNVSNRTFFGVFGGIICCCFFFLVQNLQPSQKQKGWSRTESNCHASLIFLWLFKQEIKWTSMWISRRIKGCVISRHVGPLSLQSTAAQPDRAPSPHYDHKSRCDNTHTRRHSPLKQQSPLQIHGQPLNSQIVCDERLIKADYVSNKNQNILLTCFVSYCLYWSDIHWSKIVKW